MNYLVYKHTSPSGKSYIGITCDYEQRCKLHKRKDNGCVAFAAAIKKYGWDTFLHEELANGLTLDEANCVEQTLISEYGTLVPYGYNMTPGGKVHEMLPETKQKIAIARTGKHHTEETKRKLSDINKGKIVPPEVGSRISERLKGREFSEDHKRRIGEAHKGKTISEDHVARIKAARTGTRRSPESVLKRSHCYIITDPSGTVYTITNLNQFCRDHNLTVSVMSSVAHGKYASHKGWLCKHLGPATPI